MGFFRKSDDELLKKKQRLQRKLEAETDRSFRRLSEVKKRQAIQKDIAKQRSLIRDARQARLAHNPLVRAVKQSGQGLERLRASGAVKGVRKKLPKLKAAFAEVGRRGSNVNQQLTGSSSKKKQDTGLGFFGSPPQKKKKRRKQSQQVIVIKHVHQRPKKKKEPEFRLF